MAKKRPAASKSSSKPSSKSRKYVYFFGSGRADAHYNGPNGAGGRLDYYTSECWAGHAQNFVEVYDQQYGIGTESACSPFSTAQYADIPLPQ